MDLESEHGSRYEVEVEPGYVLAIEFFRGGTLNQSTSWKNIIRWGSGSMVGGSYCIHITCISRHIISPYSAHSSKLIFFLRVC